MRGSIGSQFNSGALAFHPSVYILCHAECSEASRSQSGRLFGRRNRSLTLACGKRSVTADTALRLARYFGNSPQFWMGLQTHYDLDVAEDSLGKRLECEVRPKATAA